VKQILQSARTGAVELAEVPAPAPTRGQVLVRTRFSVMSPGTEKLALDFARKSLVGKARRRPDLVKQVLRKLRQEGPLPTYRAVANRLDAPQPLGYSSSGVVEAVGDDVAGFRPGDRVACAGAGYACHAEFAVVPENLVTRVPDGVGLEQAAFATLGAIALQGVRVAAPTLGEIAVVVGLGLIGQLTVQLLRANGCRVLGVDIDAARVKDSLALGATWGGSPGDDFGSWQDAATDGHGVDLAIVTASSETSAPLGLAAQLCRRKGRLSLVGAFPVEVDRRMLYEKELELRMSTSYGPGRYDRSYEEEGLDYPLAYVRWTENRNVHAFLNLVAAGAVQPDRLDTEIVPFESAVSVYEELANGRRRSLATVFRYADDAAHNRAVHFPSATAQPALLRAKDGDLGVAFIGAGNYAKAVLLPALAREKGVRRMTLITATGASARRTAERFGFAACGTEACAALDDPAVNLIFVATRHDSHARLTEQVLRSGKAVWLEKPVGLAPEEVAAVAEVAKQTQGFLAVGYNRRFSPHARAVHEAFARRNGALAIHYSVSAGPPPSGTWITDPREGGGRIVGEVCHFVDLCTFLVGTPPARVFAQALGRDPDRDDSMTALLTFADGSSATLAYLARGSAELPKERFEVSGDGQTALCDNYRNTRIFGGQSRSVRTVNQDKGQRTAVSEIIDAVRSARPSPFSLGEIVAVSRATFAMLESARTGRSVDIAIAPDELSEPA
jgi:polar amino acid transport system substrate-binding protein